jgi:hypothetical protein
MTVYVDDMYLDPMGEFRGMRMSHLIADTDDELHAMVDRIGVQRRWHQAPPKCSSSHYDIAMTKRAQAIKAGAIPITMRQCSAMCARRRATGVLGAPEDAIDWIHQWRASRAALKAATAVVASAKTPHEVETDEAPKFEQMKV